MHARVLAVVWCLVLLSFQPQAQLPQSAWRQDELAVFVTPPVASFDPNPKRMSWSKWHWFDAVADWNWSGREDQPIQVVAYSSCEEVELFLNGRSLGRRKTDRGSEFRAAWDAPYTPGELKAQGYRAGKTVRSAALRTAGAVAQIHLSADRDRLASTGQDLSYVTVELRDAEGNRHPKAGNLLTFALEGPGEIAGVGNANPVSVESYQRPERTAWQGRCLVVVKSTKLPGDIRLTVSSPGLAPATIVIRSGLADRTPRAADRPASTVPMVEVLR